MLSTRLKATIRQTYRQISDGLPGFVPRKEQNFLVAEIAKTLTGEYDKQRRILVAEAGTGIGKSLSYAQGAIPVARLTQKKLVISTATVALQEQLIHKDLPFYHRHSELPFRFMLVKGRQRYCCEHLLEQAASGAEMANFELDFGSLSKSKPSDSDKDRYQALWQAYTNGKWDGDRDNWPEPIPDTCWDRIAADRHTCNKALNHHQHCPFHRARNDMESADVLVVNHALLLSDLTMGGGIILPPPDECIYVLDEAHHLPTIARDHGAASASVKGSRRWLEKLVQSAGKLARTFNKESLLDPQLKLQDALASIQPDLKAVEQWLSANDRLFGTEPHYRFAEGVLPDPLPMLAENLKESSKKALRALDRMQGAIGEALKDGEIRRKEAEPLLAESGFHLQRLESFCALWEMLGRHVPTGKTPLARWMAKSDDGDIWLHASPIEVGYLLEEWLWSKCLGAVLVSATLTALSSFSYFRHQVGLKEHDGTRYLRLRSPFDYQKAELYLPKMEHEPNSPAFTNELISVLPRILAGKEASLVLFSSYRQMNEVAVGLRAKGLSLLVQGEASRNALLTLHKQKCDGGQASILFGTGSFSEGLDLPGHYLTNLVITKLPFAVPNSPVEEATAEWVEQRGGNPFLQLTVPEASRKLIQACGRLIRKEADRGRVTILDRRLLTKRYGKGLLDALPPFTRRIE
ncbi:ATP-dependent DNA helicase DinG [Aeromonas veronii]|uniref:ATP-dependent DNA helicase DinG n=1 Tax=Aeromonas veronii TaxID=654 RepID=UPI0007186179|nr:ATP-dependent DNA helicase DinG [Aeromonas veronii]HDN9001088.1 ATP-dependent DNA helicase DinG [Aeromonas veronii AMC24]KRV69675.1 ATP-dependent DNA helicase DinG [Aeromonas veronii]KRV78620.1 ATP-dependent DNA helicase DinG [Aeromonas veronii]KRV89823.1 ATP-dependent DNA helicase DinG [Aeromonas veronii]KRV91558.1 ATP-dependent DNA helicase DinG [Aeromonas veronii]